MRLLRRLAQRIEKLSDLRQPIATAPQLPCDLGVAHTLRTVFAITRCSFALGAQDAVLFPCAQCRRVNAETRASSPTVSAGPCTCAGAMVDRVPSAVATSVRVPRSASSVTCALSIRR